MDSNLLEMVAAALIALAAITTSVAFGLLVHRLDKRARREAVERQFSQAIQDVSEVRAMILAANARALGQTHETHDLNALLSLYADKLSLHISRATDLMARHGVRGAPAEHLLLASTLTEQGRIAEARPHFEIARRGVRDKFAAADLDRTYGRAAYIMGNVDNGRQLLAKACDDYITLATTIGFDKAAMLVEYAETHRRLFELEWRQGEYARAMASLNAIKSTRDNMLNPSHRSRLTRMICTIAEQLRSPPQSRAGGALSLVEDQSQRPSLAAKG